MFKYGSTGQRVTSSGTSYTLYKSGLTNTGYVSKGNSDGVIASFEMAENGQSASIKASVYTYDETETYAVKIGLLGNSDSGWRNFGMIFDVPATMTKASPTSVPSASASGNVTLQAEPVWGPAVSQTKASVAPKQASSVVSIKKSNSFSRRARK